MGDTQMGSHLPSPALTTSLNNLLRAEIAEVKREKEALQLVNERLKTENETLLAENGVLRGANERLTREIEELRSLRDNGLLQDLSASSPQGLIPSGELAEKLAQNMANVFAGIDAVLEETKQRKFEVFDYQSEGTGAPRGQSSRVNPSAHT
ncbi:unnamed protein product [Peniophora sp. CBMAI 1063]|nr:unnamed protein product [Peniophora sp. CBMAI 1063]